MDIKLKIGELLDEYVNSVKRMEAEKITYIKDDFEKYRTLVRKNTTEVIIKLVELSKK